MGVVSYTSFRRNLKSYLRELRDSADVLIINNADPSEDAVVLNLRDYEALMETVRIYNNPYLYSKLKEGIAEVKRGELLKKELLDA